MQHSQNSMQTAKESRFTVNPPKNKNQYTHAYPSISRAWYTVFVLSVLYMFSFMDRQILVLLVEPIKSDLGISDTQVSLLTGAAFAVLYAVMGIPFGWAADRYPRKWVIGLGVAIWGSMTMACGLAQSFTLIFIARMGVGVGEAALTPTAHGMIPDLFAPGKLARGMAVFAAAGALGGGLALIVGGAVVDMVTGIADVELPYLGRVRSWQLVFLLVGAMTLLAIVPMTKMVDPPRLSSHNSTNGKFSRIFIGDAFRYICEHWRAYTPMMVGLTSLNMLIYGSSAWMPSFLIRHYALSAGQVGYYLGFAMGISGLLSIFSSAWLADYLIKRGHHDAPLKILLVLIPISLAGISMAVFTHELRVSIVGIMIAQFGLMALAPLGPAALQAITVGGIRSQIAAIWLMGANLLGIGVGPTGIALITDYFFQDSAKVGYSILLFALVTTTVAFVVITVFRRDYARLAASLQEIQSSNNSITA